jgi:hypothetical protein
MGVAGHGRRALRNKIVKPGKRRETNHKDTKDTKKRKSPRKLQKPIIQIY